MSEHANDKPAGNGMIDGVTETEQLSEREHFEAVVRRYQGPLLRYVRSRLGEHDGQDVVQDVFLRLHKVMRKDGLREIGNMGSWLFRVAHNRTGDILRRKNVADRAKAELASNGNNTTSADPGGLEEVVHREDCRLALKLLGGLPVQQKQVLLLKLEEGMTYREICDVTSLPLGTVGYLINQGLGTLSKQLKAAGAI